MTGASAAASRAEQEAVPAGRAFPQFRHVVVLMLENRSFDTMLGRLYAPGQAPRGQAFEGVVGKDLTNPIPPYADQADRGCVPAGVGTTMDAPSPDPGEGYPHVNTQLFGTVLPEANRRLYADREMGAPYNLPSPAPAVPPMNGFVLDYVNSFAAEIGRPPAYDEYRAIMDCFPPEALPVLSTLAREFAVFDHWFCSVPSQTYTNRSFFHAATASGRLLNTPNSFWLRENAAETVFDRIDAAGRRGLSWTVYYDRADAIPLTALIHFPRLRARLGSNFATMEAFYRDARLGRLPAYSFIEPRLIFNHNDGHPPVFVVGHDAYPSSLLAAEVLLNDVYNAVRTSASEDGSNWGNTLLLVTFDEHGGTYDHVPPPAAPPPDPDAPAGEMGFRFDRAGLRVPAIAISAWTEAGTIVNAPYEHTAVIRTLAEQWDLGTLTERDRAAPDLGIVFNRRAPRPARDWPVIAPRAYHDADATNVAWPLNALQRAATGLGGAIFDEAARVEHGIHTVGDALAYLRGVRRRLDTEG